MGRIKIDKGCWQAVDEYAIARAGIAVTNDLAAILELAIHSRVMHCSQQTRRSRNLRIRQVSEIRWDAPRNIRENFASRCVYSEKSWSAFESFQLKMGQQLVHEWRCGFLRTPNSIGGSHDTRSGSSAG